MAAVLEWNVNHGQRNVRLFEIGSRYALTGRKPDEPEPRVLTIGATGEAREKGLYDAARDFCFADLKGDLDAIGQLACSSKEDRGIAWSPGGPDWLHAAHRGTVGISTTWIPIGVAGQLARRVADRLKLRQDVFLAEIEVDPLCLAIEAAKLARRYEPLPRFPAVERDFSLLLSDGTHFFDVTETIQSLGIKEISDIEATDLFRGKNVPAGKYSLLVRATFQSGEATLTDAQISDFSGKIIAALEKNLGAQLRAS
jgi:phenylalanyl-tRNA synthetase beta chain